MKVAFSTSGKSIDDLVDPRFGRCLFFAVIDTGTRALTVYSNNSSGLQGSAGIQAVQILVDKDVSAVITGHCGPNASLALHRAGIELYEGQGGISINQAYEKFEKGLLTATGERSSSLFNRFCQEQEGVSFGRGRLRRCNGLITQGRPKPFNNEIQKQHRAGQRKAQRIKRTERR